MEEARQLFLKQFCSLCMVQNPLRMKKVHTVHMDSIFVRLLTEMNLQTTHT